MSKSDVTNLKSSDNHQVINPMKYQIRQWNKVLQKVKILQKEFKADIEECAKKFPEFAANRRPIEKMNHYQINQFYKKLPDELQAKWRAIPIAVPCDLCTPVNINPYTEYDKYKEYGFKEGYTQRKIFSVNPAHLNPNVYSTRTSIMLSYVEGGELTTKEQADPQRKCRMIGYWNLSEIVNYINNQIKMIS